MDAKFKTPKFVTNTDSSSFVRELLITVLATTISIALTFGTAAIIDFYKKQSEKQEIVMMVMYDMYNSLESIEDCDSTITNAIEAQLQLAQDTTRFDELYYTFLLSCPYLDYTETIEHIFSSSIETINTVGNVLFTENVAEFYRFRSYYKTAVCDSLNSDLIKLAPTISVKNMLNFEYRNYAVMSVGFKISMQKLFWQCKQMMDVSDEEFELYKKKREQIEKSMGDDDTEKRQHFEKIDQCQNAINSAIKQLYLK